MPPAELGIVKAFAIEKKLPSPHLKCFFKVVFLGRSILYRPASFFPHQTGTFLNDHPAGSWAFCQ